MLANYETPKRPVVHYSLLHQAAAIPVTHTATIIRVLYGHSAPEISGRCAESFHVKLEEAFHVFIPADEWDERLRTGCGRWIWALAQAAGPTNCEAQHVGLFRRQRPDGAKSDDTGQVTWLREDGFKFRPTRSISPGWYAIWLKNRRKLRH